ncbi:ATP phosphoribosyltransferase regulatory subunit [Marinithermofilum abyssi]|uniref:ATP phosphoribosyltransferase regulatory subunit n=1 Tax=Marinithermofilum abyssi TaxID=1571185 RepID=A0A8J2VF26_9BACL|nr:ATP phosphoribosyltransferase regulatory subunit [Marinithermofilum abyssi]GGE04298.1 ATP phosphoribosyltransferase regulatory subunit [Marinithermofilum abyssi]
MAKPREFEKPTGVRDFPPRVAEKKRAVEERVRVCFERWGYREVITPTLEYFETVGGASAIEEHKLFKLLDRDGQTLVLRPDQTAPIARVVASMLREEPLPLRLYYHANVFRAQENEAGRNAEFYQSGVELVGDASPEADAEVVALAMEALQACEIEPLQIVVGHIGLLDGLLSERLTDRSQAALLKESLGQRNFVAYRNQVRRFQLPKEDEENLLSLLRIRGNREQLTVLRDLAHTGRTREAVSHLEAMWDALEDMGAAGHVVLDLSLVGSLDYYTGIYFEGYGSAKGAYLVSGGRYDRLLEQFDRPTPATGFGLKTDRLMEASPSFDREGERIALAYSPKAREEAFREARRLREAGQAVFLYRFKEGETAVPAAMRKSFDRVLEVKEDGHVRI